MPGASITPTPPSRPVCRPWRSMEADQVAAEMRRVTHPAGIVACEVSGAIQSDIICSN